MDNTLAVVLASATVGQCLLSASLLLFRVVNNSIYFPLSGFFGISALLSIETILIELAPQYEIAFYIVALGFVLLQWPFLWFYVEGLTQETPWSFQKKHMKHFIPAGFGGILIVILAFLPASIRWDIFNGSIEPDFSFTPLSISAILLLIVLMMVWLSQAGVYAFLCFRRLLRYRRRLKDVFASTDNRELSWLLFLFFLLGSVWCLHLIDFFSEEALTSLHIEESINLLMIYVLSVWGLRQAPGFLEIFESDKQDTKLLALKVGSMVETGAIDLNEKSVKKKYQSSALSDEQSLRIVKRLDELMERDKLFLDPDLSLPKLATKLGVSRNILSQILNEKIECNFFDYVNRYRIHESLNILKEKNYSVLDVAMSVGFNSRSAFYKAFKKEVGQTPSKYRLSNMS